MKSFKTLILLPIAVLGLTALAGCPSKSNNPTSPYNPSPTDTFTAVSSSTTTPTSTRVVSPTVTATPTSTGTSTPAGTPTSTGTSTAISSPTASATSSPTDTPTSTPSDTPTATITSTPLPSADVSVTVTDNASLPMAGESIVVTVTVSNSGPGAAAGLAVNCPLPSGLSFLTDSTGTGSYDSGSGVWTIGALAAGVTDTLTLTALIPSGNTGTRIDVTATASAANSPGSNNTLSFTPADEGTLSITATDNSGGSPAAGEVLTYTIQVSNYGPSDAFDVTVQALLPAGISFLSSTEPAGATYNSTTGVFTLGTLAVGNSAIMTLTAQIASSAPAGSRSFTADASAVDASTVSATDFVNVVDEAILSITNADNNPTPSTGQDVTYTLRLTNDGPSNASNVTVQALAPTGMSFVSATEPSGVTYNSTTGVFTIGTLATAATDTMIVTLQVTTSNPGDIYFTATASASDATNISGTAVVDVP